MPITQAVRNRIITSVTVSAVSILTTSAMVIVGIKRWGKMKQSIASVLSFNLNLAGFLLGFGSLITNLHKLVIDDVYYTGSFMCQLEGLQITFAGTANGLGNVIIAVERFLLIRRNRKLSLREAGLMSVTTWVWSLAMALLPIIIPDSPYVSHPSEVYCFIDWWGTKPTVLIQAYLVAFMCCGSVWFVSYAYGSIAFQVYQKMKNLESAEVTVLHPNCMNVSGTNSPNTASSHLHNDRQVYLKVVIIACGTVMLYAPITAIAAMGIIGQSMPDAEYDYIAAFLTMINTIFNVAVISLLDPTYKTTWHQEPQRMPSLQQTLQPQTPSTV